MGSPRASHLLFLDAIRGACALWVLFSHAWLQVWPIYFGQQPSGATAALGGWLLYAHFAVDCFIVLSGFCLMLPAARAGGRLQSGARRFFWRRAWRILPPYYLALILSLALIWTCIGQETGTHWDVSLPATPRAIAMNGLLLQDLVDRGSINHAFWSIAVEWRIYFLFPALLWVLRLGRPLIGGVAVVGLSFVAWYVSRGTFFEGATLQYIGLFYLGMMAARLAVDDAPLPKVLEGLGVLSSLIIVVYACSHWNFDVVTARFGYLDLFVGFIAASLLRHGYRYRAHPLAQSLPTRGLAGIGVFAYSLYLIHAPLLQVAWQLLVRPFGLVGLPAFLVLAVIGCPSIVGITYLFYLLCERPFVARVAAMKRSDPPALASQVPAGGG